jgi:hypothetical protein
MKSPAHSGIRKLAFVRETSRISNESEYKFYHSTQNVGSMINLMCFLDSSHFSNQLSCTWHHFNLIIKKVIKEMVDWLGVYRPIFDLFS